MRILVMSAMFPPDIQGGAEISAFNLAVWLRDRGHEIGVLCAAEGDSDACFDRDVDGMRIFRRIFPRPYPIQRQGRCAPGWQKPLWHLQDHLDPRNGRIVAHVLDEFQPDFVNIHYLMGIGHNTLAQLARRDIAALYILPDLTLACLRATRFRKGMVCGGHCLECRLSAMIKWREARKIPRLGFVSPSRANLDCLEKLTPLGERPSRHILNAIRYPQPGISRTESDHLRLVYVGRLDAAKGVGVLIRAAEAVMRAGLRLDLTIVGHGAEAEHLCRKFAHHAWLTFTGHLPLTDAVDIIASADAICLPSLWAENSPGAAIIALSHGVPVMASRIGGLPELVQHEENGMLVEAGNHSDWVRTLSRLITDTGLLDRLRRNASASSSRFDQDHLGQDYLDFMHDIIALPQASPHMAPGNDGMQDMGRGMA
jgi:glycosyltransferase involved in cell wall biosynthesis